MDTKKIEEIIKKCVLQIAKITGEEPLDGDATELLAEKFLYELNLQNGNLSKEEIK